MAVMPDEMRLTDVEQGTLDVIKVAARKRHEQVRRAARRDGRHDFPMLPYECSWAYEEDFRRIMRASKV
jgi:hypothetical protein